LVDKPKNRELKLKATSSKKPTNTMLNGLLELVFTRKELCHSSGLKGKPFHRTRVKKLAAIKGIQTIFQS
jgi:hypothetical protein